MAKRLKNTPTRGERRQSRNQPKNIVPFPTSEDRDDQDERYRKSKKQVVISARNHNQDILIDLLYDAEKTVVFATGPAGTGKTMLSTLYAIKELKAGDIKKIVITRPNVAVDDRSMGFLPGDLNDKMAPWVLPILDYFAEYYSQDQIRRMIESKVIEIVPTEYLRGRTFKNCVILADEVQNLTKEGMKALLTRVGEESKMILAGDIEQSDQGKDNGLSDFLDRCTGSKYIGVVEFSISDTQRSPVVKDILRFYED